MENADQLYFEFSQMMRDQGAYYNPETLYIGTVKRWDSKIQIEIDDLILDEDDLYIADYLMAGYKFPLKTSYVSSVNFGSETSGKTNPAVRSEGLKKGDLVAVMKCNDNDTYVILSRVVKP